MFRPMEHTTVATTTNEAAILGMVFSSHVVCDTCPSEWVVRAGNRRPAPAKSFTPRWVAEGRRQPERPFAPV